MIVRLYQACEYITMNLIRVLNNVTESVIGNRKITYM